MQTDLAVVRQEIQPSTIKSRAVGTVLERVAFGVSFSGAISRITKSTE